jgi:hypothetical protein
VIDTVHWHVDVTAALLNVSNEQRFKKCCSLNRNLDALRSNAIHAASVRQPRKANVFEAAMHTEIDYDLTPDQWETLKALRVPAAGFSIPNRFVLAELIALRLVAMNGNSPVITPAGRKALIRGSSRLWDVAA